MLIWASNVLACALPSSRLSIHDSRMHEFCEGNLSSNEIAVFILISNMRRKSSEDCEIFFIFLFRLLPSEDQPREDNTHQESLMA